MSDYDELYKSDENLQQLKLVLDEASGALITDLENAIKDRKSELRQRALD